DEQRLVVLEHAERRDDRVERLPRARRTRAAPVDDELFRTLGDVGVEVVHQHAQGAFLSPALTAELAAPGCPDHAGPDTLDPHRTKDTAQGKLAGRRTPAADLGYAAPPSTRGRCDGPVLGGFAWRVVTIPSPHPPTGFLHRTDGQADYGVKNEPISPRGRASSGRLRLHGRRCRVTVRVAHQMAVRLGPVAAGDRDVELGVAPHA